MRRYAIYYAPPENSPFWRFGCSVLGFDAAAFREVDYPDHPLFQDPAALAWTASPRRYGFHATLKAPFRLAEGRSEGDLAAALDRFALTRDSVALTLKLTALRGFLALVPAEPSPGIHRLADDCVRAFDAFRAPMTPSERERRHPERLEPQALAHLDRWGYPYVFDLFRFHMTLTGEMTLDDQLRLVPVLDDLFALVPPDVSIDGLALFMQEDAESRFKVIGRSGFARP